MAHAFTMLGALNVISQLPMERSQGHVGATVDVSHPSPDTGMST